jgi:hypothetical protein
VIHAADAIAFHPTGGELRAAMGTTKADNVRRAGITAVEREALAHDLDRFGFADVEMLSAVDRLPEPAQVIPRQRAGLGRNEIFPAQLFFGAAVFTFS